MAEEVKKIELIDRTAGRVIFMNRETGVTRVEEMSDEQVKEMIAGQNNTGKGKIQLQVGGRVLYKFNKSRKDNNDVLHAFCKTNPIASNRIRQMNTLVFGRGLTLSYPDEGTQTAIKAFWRYNRIREKLNGICSDAQIFGEVFIGLFPQKNGMVQMAIYESNAIEIDFDPNNKDVINKYYIAYKDEEKNKDVQTEFVPLQNFLNELEFGDPNGAKVTSVQRSTGKLPNTMIHIKFNFTSAEVHGTSDFRTAYVNINKYMDFLGDRLNIHQIYGSPCFDISIKTDDPKVIDNRIEELAAFEIGSNPVHDANEIWTPMEFNMNAQSAEHDAGELRGVIAAALGFPEHMVFNQSKGTSGDESKDGTFAMEKLAEDYQDAFGDAFADIHRFVLAVAGLDILKVDEGKIIFPMISTMSEKTKAETYVLKAGAKIVSRQTAAEDLGHNWIEEEARILHEMEIIEIPMAEAGGTTQDGESDTAGRVGGSSTIKNPADPNADHGEKNKQNRQEQKPAGRTQIMSSQKKNNG